MQKNDALDAIKSLTRALLNTSLKDELLEVLQAPNQPLCVREVAAEYEIQKTVVSSRSQSREEMMGKKKL